MLPGVKEINKYLNKWLADNDFECTVRLSTDFCFDSTNNIIDYAFVISEYHNDEFLKLCQECREEIGEVDTFILSFFHELGHYETEEIYSEKQWKSYYKMVEKLKAKEDLKVKDYQRYWRHPIELSATQWGCDYIIDNFDKVKEWWEGLKPLILNFIKLNDIELDD